VNIPTKLVIEENAYVGVNAIILDSCNYIGKYARVGAGAVVTKDVPDYATVAGVPAKIVKINKSE
jgi:acetyltransferase-like isoleucine patch superfamily enzyme